MKTPTHKLILDNDGIVFFAYQAEYTHQCGLLSPEDIDEQVDIVAKPDGMCDIELEEIILSQSINWIPLCQPTTKI